MTTILIHGTLAREQTWWRSNEPGGFLDNLARGMEQGEKPPDVWMIGGRDVSAYEVLRQQDQLGLWGKKHAPFDQIEGRFRWTGSNSHNYRLAAGEQLARYLEALATISPSEPIDIIAHSHGANVVKTATNHVEPFVNLGRVVFLGAPHCRTSDSKEILYPWNPGRLSFGSWHAPPALNIFSDQDTIQVGMSDGPVGSMSSDPWCLVAPGTTLCPLFDAFRVDPDPRTRGAYEDLEVQTRSGWGVHSELHNAPIGAALGLWLACWPHRSGADCLRQFGIALDVPADASGLIRESAGAPFRSASPAAASTATDIGEERARAIAVDYFARLNPWSKQAHVQTVTRQGIHYVVRLMPENELGMPIFFVNFKVWVNSATGEVDKMV